MVVRASSNGRRASVAGRLELVRVSLLGEIARHHHNVGGQVEDLFDRELEELPVVERGTTMDVGDLGDRQGHRSLPKSVRLRPSERADAPITGCRSRRP